MIDELKMASIARPFRLPVLTAGHCCGLYFESVELTSQCRWPDFAPIVPFDFPRDG